MSKNNLLNPVHEEILSVASEKFSENTCVYLINDPYWVAESVIILGAKNTIHCKTLIESISKKLESSPHFLNHEDYFHPIRQSGSSQSGWMILDTNSILIYAMLEEVRHFYAIDELFEKRAIVIHPT